MISDRFFDLNISTSPQVQATFHALEFQSLLLVVGLATAAPFRGLINQIPSDKSLVD
jgi:hypothetical protein